MPPSDRERWRRAAAAALGSGVAEGARFGPNSAPRVTQGLSVLGEPTILVQTTSGFDVELLLGAGLDLGRTAYAGYPISWGTPLDAAWPPVRPASPDWLGRWHGGLLTTCGMRNVGAPSAGWGLHGDHIFRQASGVEAHHLEIDGRPAVRLRGTVWDGPALGTVLELERTVVIFDDGPEVRVEDVLHNRSPQPECALMLYHLNLGAPFLTPSTHVVGVDALSARDEDSAWMADWPNVGHPQPGETELVAEATLSTAPAPWTSSTRPPDSASRSPGAPTPFPGPTSGGAAGPTPTSWPSSPPTAHCSAASTSCPTPPPSWKGTASGGPSSPWP